MSNKIRILMNLLVLISEDLSGYLLIIIRWFSMANLFWKTKKDTKSLLSKPFKSEEEFERIVFNTQEILEDIFLIKRQIRGGNKSGIPDIVGVDYDGNI